MITSERHAGGLLADVIPGPVTWYSLHFQCGPTDGTIAEFQPNGPTFSEVWESYQDRAAYLEAARQANRSKHTVCTGSGATLVCTTQ